MAADPPDNDNTDIPAAIRRRREELFGPKPGARTVNEVEAPALSGPTGAEQSGLADIDLAQAKYEMELGAHRHTLNELVEAKDALIRHLEQVVRERDATIEKLNARLKDLGLRAEEREGPW